MALIEDINNYKNFCTIQYVDENETIVHTNNGDFKFYKFDSNFIKGIRSGRWWTLNDFLGVCNDCVPEKKCYSDRVEGFPNLRWKNGKLTYKGDFYDIINFAQNPKGGIIK